MRIRINILVVILFTAWMSACTPPTKVTGSWTRMDHEPATFNKIVVLGIGHNSENRRIFEDEVETRLEARGYPVIAALDLLPPNAAIGTITKDIVNEIFISADIDAVFTMSMRHQEDTRRYVPGRGTYYTPYYSTIGFYDYYGGFSNYYYTPGHYTGSYKVFLEANLFDFKNNELLWSAQTETTNVENVHQMAVQFADAIVADFVGHHVLVDPEGSKKK